MPALMASVHDKDDDDDDVVEQAVRTSDGRAKRHRYNHTDDISKMSAQKPLHPIPLVSLAYAVRSNIHAKLDPQNVTTISTKVESIGRAHRPKHAL